MEAVQSLAKISTLRRLYLSSKAPLQDEWLKALSPSLELLSISIYTDTSNLTAAGVRGLSAVKTLQIVDLPQMKVSPQERQELSKECGFLLISNGNPLFYLQAASSCGWSFLPSWEG